MVADIQHRTKDWDNYDQIAIVTDWLRNDYTKMRKRRYKDNLEIQAEVTKQAMLSSLGKDEYSNEQIRNRVEQSRIRNSA